MERIDRRGEGHGHLGVDLLAFGFVSSAGLRLEGLGGVFGRIDGGRMGVLDHCFEEVLGKFTG